MKQKRKVKNLISNKKEKYNVLLTVLLLISSVILCLGTESLMTSSVGAAIDGDFEMMYTGLNNNHEVLYGLQFVDSESLGVDPISEFSMEDDSLYITHSQVMYTGEGLENIVNSGEYVNILGGEGNKVDSDAITIIAGNGNTVGVNNRKSTILGGDKNEIGQASRKTPAIMIGGKYNKIINNFWNVIVGGEDNQILGSSYSYILGGNDNEIISGTNVIIGGKNVKINNIRNVFAFSDSESDFEPESSGAFYLNLTNGLGLSTDAVKKGVSVSGAVGFGVINLNKNSSKCNEDKIGLIGSLDGCLIGCTETSAQNGKWELLDRGADCEEICDESECMYTQIDTDLLEKSDYTGFCVTDHIDITNATRCMTGEDQSYLNVAFEGMLIDNEDACPMSGNNKCIYRCNPGYHLTGDIAGGTDKLNCYKDCELPWNQDKRIKHNETVIGYNVEDVSCSNNDYKFPFKINPKINTGTSPETCGNYNHKKTLMCNNGVLYIMKDGKADTGTKDEVKNYKYESCMLDGYRCDTSVYNLTKGNIESQKFDKPRNDNWVVKDRGTLQGERGKYKICIDYNASPNTTVPNPVKNGEYCVTGTVSPTAYHYHFEGCQDGYTLNSGVCRKDCSLKNINGTTGGYHHGTVATGYQSSGAVCTGTCLAATLVCNDGNWRIGTINGEQTNQYPFNNCVLSNKICDASYNVQESVVTQSGQNSRYESCDPYDALGKFECVEKDDVYKLIACDEGYHTENNLYCVSNQKEVNCAKPTGRYQGSGYFVDVNVIINWNGGWNAGNWEEPQECEWKCNEGYHLEGYTCVSNIRRVSCEKNGKPEYSEYISDSYDIQWSSDGNWPEVPSCGWRCISGYFKKDGRCYESKAELLQGKEFNKVVKRLAGHESAEYDVYDAQIDQILQWTGNEMPTGVVTGVLSTADSTIPVYAWFDNGVIYYYTEAERIYLNPDSSHMFRYMNSLDVIDTTNWDTSKVTDMSYMFWSCDSLSEIDVSNWDTSNVTNMKSMFAECRSLETLDVSAWDTSKVDDMSSMFNHCDSLMEIDVSNWDTSKVTDMSTLFEYCRSLREVDVSNWDTSSVTNMHRMFGDCRVLKDLNVSGWDTSKVTDMSYTFWGCDSLMEIDVSNWDTSNVTDMNSMFAGCKSVKELDVSNWDTSKVKNMFQMFAGCESLKELDVSNWNTSNVTNMEIMFVNCSNLETLDVSDWDTSNVTDMNSMFYECKSLKELDVSNWDTSAVTNMMDMFDNCNNLEKLDVSNWDTSRVTNMKMMFYGCNSLKELDVSNWDTSKVTTMVETFYGCSSLTGLDVSNWDTSEVINMSFMFAECKNLKELDVSNWDTSSVTNMHSTFWNCKSLTGLNVSNRDTSKVTDMHRMFDGCSSLEELDVSGWDTSKVGGMSYMFGSCSNLKTIYVGDKFETDNVVTSEWMFYNDTKLIGGNGTRFSSSHVDKEYARIDRLGTPGYFTLKE